MSATKNKNEASLHLLFSSLSLRLLTGLLLIVGVGEGLSAQAPLQITLLSDQETAASFTLDSLIAQEIEALLGSRYDLTLTTLYTGGRAEEITPAITRAYASSDLVIGSGLTTSSALLARSEYPKPTIAGIVLKEFLGGAAGAVDVEQQGSGVENFTYVESPFDVGRDLKALQQIAPYERLTVVTPSTLRPTVAKVLTGVGETAIDYALTGGTIAELLEQVPAEATAAYLFPLSEELTIAEQRALLSGLTERGIATFGLLDQPMLELGGLAAYSSSENLNKVPRRIALDVLRIMDGTPAAELNTAVTTFNSGLIVNMATARRAKIFPTWEVMSNAVLLNPGELPDARLLTLEGAILEGLARNLGYDLSEYDLALAETDRKLAKSNLLPQLEVNTTFSHVDEQTAASSFGNVGRYNWTGQATLSQVVLSEPAFANVTINKLLLEGQEAALEVAQLDVIQNVANAYLGVLQTKAFADLQNENLAVTRAQLDNANTKLEAGSGGASDVYRWESEMALNRISSNDANAQLAQARYNLNQLLNRPIDEEFQLPEFTGQDTLLGMVGERLLPLINNQQELSRYAKFLAEEARRDLPTLHQLEAAIKAQKRQQLASKRAYLRPNGPSTYLRSPSGGSTITELVTTKPSHWRWMGLTLVLLVPPKAPTVLG